jgi:hypothetical protein
MTAAPLLIEALGGTQDRQTGQRPDAVGPREGSQHYTGEPAQATDFDKMRLGRPHGIAVDAFGGDPIAASAFDGIIKAQDDDTTGNEHGREGACGAADWR